MFVMSVMARAPRRLSRLLGFGPFLVATGISTGCPSAPIDMFRDEDSGAESSFIDIGADEKAHMYNLIGRWYAQPEIQRLTDPSLTPEQWCEREPAAVSILPDGISVRCDNGVLHSAGIARVLGGPNGEVTLSLRAKESSELKMLKFEQLSGPKAIISGSPCFPKGGEPHFRFPEYEILARQILGGRRCAQLTVRPQASP